MSKARRPRSIAELKAKLKKKKAESPHDRLIASAHRHGDDSKKSRRVKKSKKSRRSSARSDSSAASSSDNGDATSVFGDGSASSKTVRELALLHPGALFEEGLQDVARLMGLEGAGPRNMCQEIS